MAIFTNYYQKRQKKIFSDKLRLSMFLWCSYFFRDFSLDVLIKGVLIKKRCMTHLCDDTFFLSLWISYLGKMGKNNLVTLSLALYRAWSSGRKGAKIEHFSRYFALKKKVNYNYTMNIYFESSYCQKILGRSYEKKKKRPAVPLIF